MTGRLPKYRPGSQNWGGLRSSYSKTFHFRFTLAQTKHGTVLVSSYLCCAYRNLTASQFSLLCTCIAIAIRGSSSLILRKRNQPSLNYRVPSLSQDPNQAWLTFTTSWYFWLVGRPTIIMKSVTKHFATISALTSGQKPQQWTSVGSGIVAASWAWLCTFVAGMRMTILC